MEEWLMVPCCGHPLSERTHLGLFATGETDVVYLKLLRERDKISPTCKCLK